MIKFNLGFMHTLYPYLLFPLVLLLLLYFLQHKLIYFPRKYAPFYKALIADSIKIKYTTTQGRQTAFFIPPKNKDFGPAFRLWVLFSGNAALALDWMDFLENFPDPNTGFLLIDYPGYGFSEGNPSPKSISESSTAAFTTLAGKIGIAPEKLISSTGVLGHSLGAAAGLGFATKHKIRTIVLISAFTSLKDMALRMVGFPLNQLVSHRFDNRKLLNKLRELKQSPHIHLFHGSKDDVVPVKMGRALAKEFKELIEYKEVEGLDHNSILMHQKDELHQVMLLDQDS